LTAGEVPAVPAKKHAHMDLVFLAFQPPEEPLDTFVIAARRRVRPRPVDDKPPLGLGKVGPGHIQAQTDRLGETLEVRQTTPIVRLGPGIDRTAVDRLMAVGYHESHVELDRVAETVAGRA